MEPFVEAGFGVERSVVLTASQPRPPARPSSEVTIRVLKTDADWAQSVELQVQSRELVHEEAGYREFKERARDRYRSMEAAGLGHWYGAFIGDRLVADLGVFHDGRGLGRYQAVETHPDLRRRGIAGTLVYEAGRMAIAEHGLRTLVIIADEDGDPSHAFRRGLKASPVTLTSS